MTCDLSYPSQSHTMEAICSLLESGREEDACKAYLQITPWTYGDLVSIALHQKAAKLLAILIENNHAVEELHLSLAIASGLKKIVQVFVDHGIKFKSQEPANNEMTWLMVCARVGTVPVARLLLREGCVINAQDREGKTALQHCLFGVRSILRIQLAKFLLSQGADERIKEWVEKKDFLTMVLEADQSSKAQRLVESVVRWRTRKNLAEASQTLRSIIGSTNKINIQRRLRLSFLEISADILREVVTYL